LALGLQGEWINLYGTTEIGGTYGRGTVFALLNSAAATTTTLTSAPNPSTYGQAVTLRRWSVVRRVRRRWGNRHV